MSSLVSMAPSLPFSLDDVVSCYKKGVTLIIKVKSNMGLPLTYELRNNFLHRAHYPYGQHITQEQKRALEDRCRVINRENVRFMRMIEPEPTSGKTELTE